MNKEELELVLEAIKQLGEAGQSAFIWWCILNFLSNLVTPCAFVSAVFIIAKTISKTVIAVEANDMKAIAAALNTNLPLSSSELNRAIDKIKSK